MNYSKTLTDLMTGKKDIIPICIGCKKPPDEIDEYIEGAEELEITPTEYVQQEEGTYNVVNGHFVCTDCYIEMGMPSRPYPEKWIAP